MLMTLGASRTPEAEQEQAYREHVLVCLLVERELLLEKTRAARVVFR